MNKKLKYIALLFILFGLSQIPMLVINVYKEKSFSFDFSTMIYIVSLVAVMGLGLWLASVIGTFKIRPRALFSNEPNLRDIFTNRDENFWKWLLSKEPEKGKIPRLVSFILQGILYGMLVFGGFLLMVCSQIPSVMLTVSKGYEQFSQNQEILSDVFKVVPAIAFSAAILIASIFEEVIFRYGIFSLFSKGKQQILAFILSVALFTILHMTGSYGNAAAWLSYAGLSIVLTTFYAIYRNIYLNIAIHLLYNLMTVSVLLQMY